MKITNNIVVERAVCELYTAPHIEDFNPSTNNGIAIDFAASHWKKVKTLERKLIQNIWMDVSQHTRYIALARKGFINLAEVEVFKSGNKVKRLWCKVINNMFMNDNLL